MSEDMKNNKEEVTSENVNPTSTSLPDDYLSPNSTLSEFSSTLLGHYLTTYGAWKVSDGSAAQNGVLLSATDAASPYSINRQYMFGDKGLNAREILGDSNGTVGDWKKLGVRGATVVVGPKANYDATEVDFLCPGSNDHITIASAINSLPADGGTVLLLEGTYQLGASLFCSKSNVTVRGCGCATVLHLDTSISVDTAIVRITGQNCTVCDLKIQGNSLTDDGYTAAVLASGSYSRVMNVEATSCSGSASTSMAVVKTGSYGTVAECYIHECYSAGDLRLIETGSNSKITDNRCMYNGGQAMTYGIYCTGSNTVSGNHIIGNCCDADSATTVAAAKSYGIYLNGSRCSVANNVIGQINSQRPVWGIYIAGTDNAVNANNLQNLVGTPTMSGIETADKYNSISGNTFWGNINSSATEMTHIKINSDNNAVIGNTSDFAHTTAATKPILLTANAKNNTVVGNRIKEADVTDNNTDASNPNVVGFNNDAAGSSLPEGSTINFISPSFEEIGSTGQYKDVTNLDDLPTGITIVQYVDGPNIDGYMVLTTMDINAGGYMGQQIKITTSGMSTRTSSIAIVNGEATRRWSAWTPVGGGNLANVDVPDAGYVQIGKGASAATGYSAVAIGDSATANDGSVAIGSGATAYSGGGAVGVGANAENGGAVGNRANAGYAGGAVGMDAVTYTGASVGSGASSYNGGAIGNGTKTSDGFAGGAQARAVDASGNGIDAIQLGTGTNTTAKSLQVYGYRMMDANGKIPAERLPDNTITLAFEQNASGNWVDVTDLDNLPNGLAMVHYHDGPALGGYLVFTSVDPNTGTPQGYYGHQIKISPSGTFTRTCSMTVVGNEAKRAWSAWTAQN